MFDHECCTVDGVRAIIGEAVGCPPSSLKLVHKGMTLPAQGHGRVALSDGDVVLAVPQRKPPTARIVSAAIGARSGSHSGEPEEEEADEPASLPPGAAAWEVAIVEAIRSRGCPPWALEWVVLIRPKRAATLIIFLAGCFASSKLGLGPVFILGAMIWFIFTNLGKRKEGDVSAYSIFNADVQRLPGQLDADQIDQQIRRGQLG